MKPTIRIKRRPRGGLGTLVRAGLGLAAASVLRATGVVDRAVEEALTTESVLGLYFHDPTRDRFVGLVRWLSDCGFRFLSANELIECLASRRFPKGAAWLTFDDGWRRNLVEVVPSIRELRVPVTFFISTGEVQHGRFWFTEARQHERNLPPPFTHSAECLWLAAESERARAIASLRSQLPRPQRDALSPAEVAEIAAIPQITIGSHSVNHAILPNCSDDELRTELSRSRQELQTWTGKPVTTFSYPNGDWDERCSGMMAECGYELAATIETRLARPSDDRFTIPRFAAMEDMTLSESKCHAVGVLDPAVEWLRSVISPDTPSVARRLPNTTGRL